MTTYEVIPNFMTNHAGLFEDYKSEKPLRVAMLIQTYHPAFGGAGKQLSILAPLLKRQGIDLHIITLRQPGMNRFEIVKGIPVHRLAIPVSDVMKSMSFSLNAMPLLRQLRPDLVHSHALLSPTTTAVMAKRLNGTPVVAKVLRSGILGDISKLRRKPFGARRMAAFKTYVDAFIAESQEINRELRDAGIPTDKRIFIPNGVDTSRFKPVGPLVKRAIRTNLRLPSGPLAIFTGRLTMDKRLDQLLYVWNDVRKKYEDANLLIVGGGEQEARLRSLAGEGVIFTGHVEEVTPYLNAADLFVLPSATGGLSNAMLEGMAAGLPVIATDVGGAPDLIQNGVNGRLIKPDQPETLYSAIAETLRDRHHMTLMGQNSREQVSRDYALQTVSYRLRSLYDSIVANRSERVLLRHT